MTTKCGLGDVMATLQCTCRLSSLAEPLCKLDLERSLACSITLRWAQSQQMQGSNGETCPHAKQCLHSIQLQPDIGECTHGVTCCGLFTDCFWFICTSSLKASVCSRRSRSDLSTSIMRILFSRSGAATALVKRAADCLLILLEPTCLL